GGDLGSLIAGIQAREQRRRTLQQELAGLQALKPLTSTDLGHLQREVEVRVADWRGLLTRQGAPSRQILQKLLLRRVVFRRREDGTYEFSGQATLGKLLAGIVCTKAGVAPMGFEPVVTRGRSPKKRRGLKPRASSSEGMRT